MTAKEVIEQLGKLIAETSDDPFIVQILNKAQLKLRERYPPDTSQSFMV